MPPHEAAINSPDWPVISVFCQRRGNRNVIVSRTGDNIALELSPAESECSIVAYTKICAPTEIVRGIPTEVPLRFTELGVNQHSTVADLESAIARNLLFEPE